MKVLLISVFLVSLSVLATSEPPLVKTANECAKDNKIPHEEAMDFMKSYKMKKETQNIKCFINCIFERSPILDVVKKRLKGQKHNCDSIKDTDKCAASFKKFKCLIKIENKLRKQAQKG